MVGPKLQEKINRKRLELVQPLDELEATITTKLKAEYDQTRAINNTLLHSSPVCSKVEENRKRYLDMIGVTDREVDKFVAETDRKVSELLLSLRALSRIAPGRRKNTASRSTKYRPTS